MSEPSIKNTKWTEIPIAGPSCGNHGEPDGKWKTNAWVPFKLIEDVIRSFAFSATIDEKGTVDLMADVNTDSVDWQSASNQWLECMSCFAQVPIPKGGIFDFY